MNFIAKETKTVSFKLDDDRTKRLNRIAFDLSISPEEYSKTDLMDKIIKIAEERTIPVGDLKKKCRNLEEQNKNVSTELENYKKKDEGIVKLL